MLEILLVRHAKSCWSDPSVEDFSRKLSKRGKDDLKLMPEKILEIFPKADYILCSPAKRTKKTLKGILKRIVWAGEINMLYLLYLADRETLFNIVRHIDDSYQRVVLIGHNEGITELANHLQDNVIDNIPTLGVVKISFKAKKWSEIRANSGNLESFIYPKKYE